LWKVNIFILKLEILEDISFNAPDLEEGTKITVDLELVQKMINPILKKSDLSKFLI
jgi:ATP-dependent protease HslVU (ClpYQ) ATPase subunit